MLKHILLITILLSISYGQFEIYDSYNIDFVHHYLGGPCKEVYADDDIILASSGSSLLCMEITDDSIDTIGNIFLPGHITDITASSELAITCNEGYGFSLIDISIPENPRYITRIENSHPKIALINGIYAYLADESDGLAIYSVITPSEPELIYNIYLPGLVTDMEISGNDLFITYSRTMRIYDISIPTSPRELSNFALPENAYSVAVSDTIAYLGIGSEIYSLNIADIESPIISCHKPTLRQVTNIALVDDIALISTHGAGLRLFDVSDSIIFISSYGGWNRINDVSAQNTDVQIAMRYDGLINIDISDPFSPIGNSSFEMASSSYGITITDSILFVADMFNGLHIINISDPLHPIVAGHYNDLLRPKNSAYTDNHVLVAELDGRLSVINIENPSAPYRVDSIRLTGQFEDIVIRDSLAYTVAMTTDCDANQLIIYNISDFTSIYEISRSPIQACTEIVLEGDFVYIAQESDGIRIIDISDPHAPEHVYTYNTPDIAFGVFIKDSLLYIADSENGLLALNVSNPYEPFVVGHFHTEGQATAIDIIGDWAFVACYNGGMQVLNIANPALISEIGYFRNGSPNWDVKVHNGYVYASFTDNGVFSLAYDSLDIILEEFDNTTQPEIIRLKAYPNPFNSAVNIKSKNKIYIYDTNGILIDEIDPKGNNEIIWQPKSYIESGIYLAKTAYGMHSTKLVYIK